LRIALSEHGGGTFFLRDFDFADIDTK